MSDYEGSAPIVGGLIGCQRIPISLLCGLFGSSLCSNGALLSERVTQLCDKPPWASTDPCVAWASYRARLGPIGPIALPRDPIDLGEKVADVRNRTEGRALSARGWSLSDSLASRLRARESQLFSISRKLLSWLGACRFRLPLGSGGAPVAC
jgi:hypothetical protein